MKIFSWIFLATLTTCTGMITGTRIEKGDTVITDHTIDVSLSKSSTIPESESSEMRH